MNKKSISCQLSPYVAPSIKIMICLTNKEILNTSSSQAFDIDTNLDGLGGFGGGGNASTADVAPIFFWE